MPARGSMGGRLAGGGWGEGEGDLAETGGEGFELFGEDELAVVEEADVGGEGFDSARSWEEMRMVGRWSCGVTAKASEASRERGRTRAIRASMSSSRTRGSRPEKGSSSRMSWGEKARTLARAAFMSMPRLRCLELAVEGELKLADEGGVVPGGVEALEVAEELADGHPVGELLVFAGVADAG